MRTSTKFALAAASITIFSFGGQMQNAYAKPQTPVPVVPHASTKVTVLKVGSEGPAVKQAQKILKQEGFYKGAINGIFSPQMEAAVKAFQKSERIHATGIIGPETQAAFN